MDTKEIEDKHRNDKQWICFVSCDYIIKRIELTEKAYTHAEEDAEETEYADVFANYRTTVKNYTYSELLKEYAKSIVVNTTVIEKYSMKDTYLSKDIYYNYG